MFTKTPQKKEIVYVGLSGGVDSSVAAKRLIDEGHTVVGVFIKTWQPDFLVCNWEAERLDAMRVAAHLGIPFHTCDAETAYRDSVAMYMIEEYKKGRTPNPDVMCNQFVKFGTFLEYALQHGATKIATGHYAQVSVNENRIYELARGIDSKKDQSYFLWTLTQEQLSHTLFPVGNSPKTDIRREAIRSGIPTAKKSDSQGICFLGEIDIKDFLSHYISVENGNVLDESGSVIGVHDGALYYTLGQRHGFSISSHESSRVPQYVVSKNLEANTIVVAPYQKGFSGKTMRLTNCNLPKDCHTLCVAQCRYHQRPFEVSITITDTAEAVVTVLDNDTELPSLGQSCVLYKGNKCLGGGIIEHIT